jgi:thiol-disulfide isomerase/thioredoxin
MAGRLRTVAAALVVGVGITACSPAGGGVAEEAPIPFDLETLDGSRVRAEDLRGRYVLLDFWATWCPPCVLEIPELNAFHREYAGQADLMAVSIDDLPPGELSAWLQEKEVAYPVALGTEDLARRYGAHGFPFHVLISPDGTILERLTPGFHDRKELAALVERHLPD